MIIIHMTDSRTPALKNGIGKMRGPTPSRRLTDVNNAEYFGCIELLTTFLRYCFMI